MSAYLGKTANGQTIDSSTALSDYLLDSVRVVTVPGDGFGAPGYLRFSYATNLETIKTGIERVRTALAQLH
jgi:aspartate aminotransferase